MVLQISGQREIGTVEKNVQERIVVQLATFGNVRKLDCRQYFFDSEGTLKPSRKGFVLGPEKIEALIGLLAQAKAAWEAEGGGEGSTDG
jgi:hypothetical protein